MTSKIAFAFALTLACGLAYGGTAAACGGEHEDEKKDDSARLCGGEHEDEKKDDSARLCGGEHEDEGDKDES
jgi:hypothetical protein